MYSDLIELAMVSSLECNMKLVRCTWSMNQYSNRFNLCEATEQDECDEEKSISTRLRRASSHELQAAIVAVRWQALNMSQASQRSRIKAL